MTEGRAMSEAKAMSGPFDAAIQVLEEFIGGEDGAEGSVDCEIKAAIRVLEAAGKVDKGSCLAWTSWAADCMHEYLGQNKWEQKIFGKSSYTKHLQDIRGFENTIKALLDSLPDKEKP